MMPMIRRVLILVEGQTEERFVKDILAPHFSPMGMYIYPTLLVTKTVVNGPNYKGGVSRFSKIEKDIQRLHRNPGDALITTLLDYYGLPDDSPGMNSRAGTKTPLERVQYVEQEIHRHFGSPRNLLVFLALHELEAWIFSEPAILPELMSEPAKQNDFKKIRDNVKTPEDINEGRDSAPSKRIGRLFPSYRKTLHAPTSIQRIGLARIRRECPHFNAWIQRLENFARSGTVDAPETHSPE